MPRRNSMRISEGSAIRASAILFTSFYFISGRIKGGGQINLAHVDFPEGAMSEKGSRMEIQAGPSW